MTTVTVSKKGWVVIPAELRKKYNLKPGTEVQVVDYGGVLSLVPALDDPVRGTLGLLSGSRDDKKLTQALLEEHKEELGNE